MQARISYYLATIHRELGDTELAEKYARLGIDAAKTTGDWEPENRAALATVLFDTGCSQEASAELARCLAAADSASYPTRKHIEQAEKVIRELANAWSIPDTADFSETTSQVGRELLARSTASVHQPVPTESFPDPATARVLHDLAAKLSIPESGQERWHWDRKTETGA